MSKFRFYLHIYPTPSHYHEVGRFLEIPMMPKAAGDRYVLNFSGINEWTEPKVPLGREYLEEIAARIQRDPIGLICHFGGAAPAREQPPQAKAGKGRGFMNRWF